MNVHYSSRFRTQYKKLQNDIKAKVRGRIVLLIDDEFNPYLGNHMLSGEYRGCRSINVTRDWRILYEKYPNGAFHLIAIGTHAQLYGK